MAPGRITRLRGEDEGTRSGDIGGRGDGKAGYFFFLLNARTFERFFGTSPCSGLMKSGSCPDAISNSIRPGDDGKRNAEMGLAGNVHYSR